LFYATGTNEKAFMSSAWRMSKNEVERANETKLEFGGNDTEESPMLCGVVLSVFSKEEEKFNGEVFI